MRSGLVCGVLWILGSVPAAAQSQAVAWRSAVGVSVSGSGLTKTASTGWGNAGAVSTQTLEFGGYVEFSTTATNTQQMIGLASGDASQSYTDIEYALFLSNGSLDVYEGGTYRGTFGTYVASDRFRVEVASGKARYFKNGVVLYSGNTAPKYPLLVDAASYTVGATLTNVRIGDMGWRKDVGVAASGDSLTKTGSAGWNAGAVSIGSLLSGDGYVEFTATETNKARIGGLSRGDGGPTAADVDFGLQLNADATVAIFESGVARGSQGSYAAGDRFRVEARGGIVRYYRNQALLYTSELPPEYPTYADVALYETGATLTDVVFSNVIWEDAVGVSVAGTSLVKTGSAGWNAGSVSTSTIESGSGYVEFTALETGTNRACGLGRINSSEGQDDIDFAILLTSGAVVQVVESGVVRGSFGSYAPGDRLRVEVSPGLVRYRRNGAVIYTSAVAPVYPLSVDSSLNETGATIANVEMGNAVWLSDSGVMVRGSGFQSTVSGWGAAGAASAVSLASGPGWVESTAEDTLSYLMFGLGTGNTSTNYTDIEHAMFLSAGSLQVYESGVSRGAFGTYLPGDRLRVEILGGVVRYLKNGTAVYTSGVAPQYPVLVDTATNTTNARLSEVIVDFGSATKVPTPSLSPAPGVYGPPQSVTISCSLPTAQIRYTTDGSVPTSSSTLYTAPISLSAPSTIKARGFQAGLTDSNTATGVYSIEVAAPAITPVPGTYSSPTNLTMTSATSGAEIRYTLDGSEPTTSSTLYSAAVGLSLPATVKAKAFKLGLASTTTTGAYAFKAATPAFSLSPGTYGTNQSVTVSCSSPGVAIHYTTSGAEPSEADPVVASGGSVSITATTTLKAAAWRTGWQPSTVAAATYTLQVATPTLSLPSGSYAGNQTVTVSTATSGAQIRYSTTGREPTPFDPVVASGSTVNVTVATTLKAKAWKAGWTPSATAQASYVLSVGGVATPTFSPAPGTYTAAQSVSIVSSTPGSFVRYTLDGADPGLSSPIFGRPLAFGGTATIKARAYHADGVQSAVGTAAYTIDSGAVATPVLSVPSGSYTTTRAVTITDATPSAEIRYTTNGADPTTSDLLIASGSSVTVDRAMVVKAKAWKAGLAPSAVTRRDYLITGAIAAGAAHTLALKADGTVVAWGNNAYGQVGDGTSGNVRTTPVAVSGLSNVVAIAAGAYHSLALKSDGSVFAWGNNPNGQIGDGSSGNTRPTPVQVGTAGNWLTGITAVAGGGYHSLALRTDGTVAAWGFNDNGQLGDNSVTSRTTPVTVTGLAAATGIAAGESHSLALKADGTAAAWGRNTAGQVGDGTTIGRLTATAVSGLSGLTAVAAGGFHSLALRSAGHTGALWSWGANNFGQLGDDTLVARSWPTRGLSAQGVGVGRYHTTTVAADGSAWAWGTNGNGPLGIGFFSPSEVTPRRVARLPEPLRVAGGYDHAVALMADGTLRTWGANALGDGTTTARPQPQAIPAFSLVPNSWMVQDTDLDGLTNAAEYRLGSDPLNSDSNGDGIADGPAAASGRSVTSADADGDGLQNAAEVAVGTDPFRTDTDGDGTADALDAYPLDPSRSSPGTFDPGDHTPPTITLSAPSGAVPLP